MRGAFAFVGRGLLLAAICTIAVEVALRAQQYLGPIYDLEMDDVNRDLLSEDLNHRPARHRRITLSSVEMYGEFSGYSYTEEYDDHGIKQPVGDHSGPDCRTTASIMFMGDSFIQGYDEQNTVPHQVAKALKDDHDICIRYYNAGYTSYSPAIFIPLARKLLPIVKPDYVVVDIDETDLFDDAVRYDDLIKRDGHGHNIGVRPSPIMDKFLRGLMSAREHFFYLQRLIAKVRVTYLEENQRLGDIFWASRDQSAAAASTYARELAVFKRNIRELCKVVSSSMQGGDRLIFAFHPHLQHLARDKDGFVWNNLVRSSIEQVATADGALFFDSTATLKRSFKGEPGKYYWTGDMHFNFLGIREYSRALANYLAKKMR
jgi:hypothetical protein